MTEWEVWPKIDLEPRETRTGVQFTTLGEGRFRWRGSLYRIPRMVTDFASVPRLLRPLVGQIGRHAAAAVAHDAGYRGLLEIERLVDVPRTAAVQALAAGKSGEEALQAARAEVVAADGRIVIERRFELTNLDRAECDRLFLDLMVASGSKRWRRHACYAGVRAFGWAAYRGVPCPAYWQEPTTERCTLGAGHIGEHVDRAGHRWLIGQGLRTVPVSERSMEIWR